MFQQVEREWFVSRVFRQLAKRFRIIWLACCVLILGACLIHANSPAYRDNIIVLVYVMLALSFPLGFLAIPAMGLFPESLLNNPNNYVALPVAWAPLAIAGYVQWFLLAPWLVRMISRSWSAVHQKS